jgi:hypothetical protein
MNKMKRYEVAGLRFDFSPNGNPLAGVLGTAIEDAGPYVAEVNLTKPRNRKDYAGDAHKVCGMDAGRVARVERAMRAHTGGGTAGERSSRRRR